MIVIKPVKQKKQAEYIRTMELTGGCGWARNNSSATGPPERCYQIGKLSSRAYKNKNANSLCLQKNKTSPHDTSSSSWYSILTTVVRKYHLNKRLPTATFVGLNDDTGAFLFLCVCNVRFSSSSHCDICYPQQLAGRLIVTAFFMMACEMPSRCKYRTGCHLSMVFELH
jgi:hypothetical protein